MEAVRQSCAIKAEIVSRDEREQGLRAILNFGHTVGHALESLTNYQVYRHGEAIAAGMAVAASLAVSRGLLDAADRERLGGAAQTDRPAGELSVSRPERFWD